MILSLFTGFSSVGKKNNELSVLPRPFTCLNLRALILNLENVFQHDVKINQKL